MAIISQETWDNMPEEEKDRIRNNFKNYESIINSDNDEEAKMCANSRRFELIELYGKENLQYKFNKIKTWADVKKNNLIDDTLLEQLASLTYWNSKTKAICDKCRATLEIEKLIELGYGGVITSEEWEDESIVKYNIENIAGTIVYNDVTENYSFISFRTDEAREEFMAYPDNVELVRNYFMI